MKLFLWLALLGWPASIPAKDCRVYFGTFTGALSRGIYVSRLDPQTGALSAPELAAASPSPNYLAVSPDGKFLYAANGVKGFRDSATENGGAVSAFAIEQPTGKLTFLNQKCSGGAGPCHVSVDATGKVLFIANYGDGSAKAYLLETNGALGEGGDRVARTGHSVNTHRQASAHAHFICADPSNRFALVCDLGTDEVIAYPFEAGTAKLSASRHEAAGAPPGAGPRHLAFSRNGRSVYVLNEMGCSISRFELDDQGRLTPRETISALPTEAAPLPSFTAAEILAHPSGKYFYATIRGHDSVSVFTAEEPSGRLALLQNLSAGGKVPRGMGIDPTGRWLLVANQKTDNVVEYAIDGKSGKLTPTAKTLTVGSPVDVKFVTAQ